MNVNNKLEENNPPVVEIENTPKELEEIQNKSTISILEGTTPLEGDEITADIVEKLTKKPKQFSPEAVKFFENGGELTRTDIGNEIKKILNEIRTEKNTRENLTSEEKENLTKTREDQKNNGLFEGIPSYQANVQSYYKTHTEDIKNKMKLLPLILEEVLFSIPRPINKNNYKNLHLDAGLKMTKVSGNSQGTKIKKRQLSIDNKILNRENSESGTRLQKLDINVTKFTNQIIQTRKQNHPEEREKIQQKVKKQVISTREVLQGKDPEKVLSNIYSHIFNPIVEQIIEKKANNEIPQSESGDISKPKNESKPLSTKKLQESYEQAEGNDEKIKLIEASIEATGEGLPESKRESLKDSLLNLDFKGVMENFAGFFKYVMDIIHGKGNLNKNIDNLFNVNKMDFTKETIEDLILAKQPPNEGEPTSPENAPKANIEDILDIETGRIKDPKKLGKGSLLGRLYQKKANTSVGKDIMYTAAISKIKDTVYLKRKESQKNQGKRNTELESGAEGSLATMQDNLKKENKKQSQEERILREAQVGDMIFFMGGTNLKRYDKALLGASGSMAAQHVGIITEIEGVKHIAHSTMKKYDTGRSGGHQVPLTQELNERSGGYISLIRPKKEGSEVATRAQKLIEEKVGYDNLSAALNILGQEDKNPKNMNCAEFVAEALGVEQTGVPAHLVEQGCMEYTSERI